MVSIFPKKNIFTQMKKTFTLLAIYSYCLFLASCGNGKEEYIDPRGTDYAGAESCIQCHQSAYDSHFETAHHFATAPATPQNVLGNFNPGHNTFLYDQHTKLSMEKRGDSLYQVLYKGGQEVHAYPFDIVFGTSNAQTSAYWKGNNTYQLAISYYNSVNRWATSPGFPADKPYFERKIPQDCYACHSSSTSAPKLNSSSKQLDMFSVQDGMSKKGMIYGIDCERCHGPAKKHITHHLEFPDDKTSRDIISYKSMSRQQKLDACAICHSGNDGLKMKSRFEFNMGDNLSNFYSNVPISNITDGIDVHGNQYGLLSQSNCFKKSGTLDCITCHNPHSNAEKSSRIYSKVCIGCHNGIKHRESTAKLILNKSMKNNCIECHMPKQSSKAIKFQLSGKSGFSSYNLRTHNIAIYPPIK